MDVKKTTNSMSLFARFFYILITLIFLVKAESTIYAPTECSYYSHPTETELVVTTATDYDLSLFKIDAPPKPGSDFAVAHIDFISLCKLTLLNYDNYVRHQLKSHKSAFLPNQTLLAILQKHNVWHQSSGEDPVL